LVFARGISPQLLAHRSESIPFRNNRGGMRIFTPILFVALLCIPNSASTQQAPSSVPATAPASSTPSGQAADTSPSPASKRKKKPVPSFLIIGTVFDEKALSLPGAQVRVRPSGEKKFRWETYTNSRGEFAVRVPPGYEYEVLVNAKNYQDQSQRIDSKVDVQQRLSIKLEPRSQLKTGAKP
jgi:carboxypeptidase family protein